MPEHNIDARVTNASNSASEIHVETGHPTRPDEGAVIRRTLSMCALVLSVFSVMAYVFFVHPEDVGSKPDWFMIA